MAALMTAAELSTKAAALRRPVLTVLAGGLHDAAMQDHHHPRWTTLINDHRAWLARAMLSPHTITLRCYQLRRLAEAFPSGPAITTDQLAGWIAARGWAAGTIRSFRGCFASFYRWACKNGHVDVDPTVDLPKAPRQRLKPRPAPLWVVDQGLAAADERLTLMIRLARQCGLRRGEIAVTHTTDLSLDDDGWWITAHGKGAKLRTVPISTDLVVAIHLWMNDRTGWLFPGRIAGHLAPATVGRLISRGLAGQWSAHPLRHRFATDAYSGTHDLAAVQELLGHERPETTRIYVEVDRGALRRAAAFAAA